MSLFPGVLATTAVQLAARNSRSAIPLTEGKMCLIDVSLT